MRPSRQDKQISKIGFNPRICKRCDICFASLWDIFFVSIHASVKDATFGHAYDKFVPKVSIHASVKDATLLIPVGKYIPKSFNPRICKRCDKLAFKRFSKSSVSIHASVKDATQNGMVCLEDIFVSIHASVKDATVINYYLVSELDVSIHASVKDATHWNRLYSRSAHSFNPRICKRCDALFILLLHKTNVSIHASVKDATGYREDALHRITVSIHASVKDAT